ncbi:MAG: PocR ligand-binding domain-containing protein [Chloroflexi bacterium]|nr:PocR ligand-binding domain-containing protein [Chloroflexota bacterium]MBI3167458.1 PocR ligand-binding domain-containing protein [Chloroflexota bacterium]
MPEGSPQKWPFVPTCLNDVLDIDRLAIIEAGSYERLGRPITILDFDPETGNFTHRIESKNEKQRYAEFCAFFRDETHVKGGDIACKNWDIHQAKVSLAEFNKNGNPFRLFSCHMGMTDMTYVIHLGEKPLAVVFSGQYGPEKLDGVTESLRKIVNNGRHGEISMGQAEMDYLNMLAGKTAPIPENARERLKEEASYIQQIVEAEFERRKWRQEREFLDEVRDAANMPKEINLEQLRQKIQAVVSMVRDYCHCEYALFFAGAKENDTVLIPFAQAGLPASVADRLPHFNWSKAKLPLENFILDQPKFSGEFQQSLKNGLRGGERDRFSQATCMIPTAMGDRYRSVLVLGPFAEPVQIEAEKQFLIEIARIIGVFARTGFEVLYLEQERRRWKNTAALLTHEYKTALTTITTPIGMARNMIQKGGTYEAERADEYLRQAEDRSLLLGRITSGTLEGIVVEVEPEDLEIEKYPLSALVENCASGFMELARTKSLELIIDSSIGLLPHANLDVPRITIALANLIENAIKYSFSKSRIIIRSRLNIASGMNLASAIIEVDNLGFEIHEEDRHRIFEEGERGVGTARIRRIPGSGYGLWEARSIVEAHGGEIHVNFHPTAIRTHEGRASRVVFSVEIPLKRRKT